MDLRQVVTSQYQAALEMLRQAMDQCPESLWDDRQFRNRFWHVAYHVLFYTHLYLQASESDFVPWTKHREHHHYLGRLPWPPHSQPSIGEPYTRQELQDYLRLCQEQVEQRVSGLDFKAESGFYWLPFGKLELQIYNIRHKPQYTGKLMERLGTREGIEVDWVSHAASSQARDHAPRDCSTRQD